MFKFFDKDLIYVEEQVVLGVKGGEDFVIEMGKFY